MAKSLSSIMSQIERLQKEAAAIQSEVVVRIQKEIAKYGLTAEQLFGGTPARKTRKATSSKVSKSPKYADGVGNTWGGMGKRPQWLHEALAAGKALEEFLVSKAKAKAPAPKKSAARKKAQSRAVGANAKATAAPAKRAAAKKVARKARAKSPAAAEV